jgi:hypothetical protein
MIRESIQQTINLIETTRKAEPAAYQEDEIVLDDLVNHMRLVIDSLNVSKEVA